MNHLAAPSQANDLEKPRAVKIALWALLGLAVVGATYLYSVRGNAIILDLSSGIAGLLCL